MRLGFIGTGAITEAMVRGLKRSALADWPVMVSPRGAEVAARLAELPGVTVAADNQAVVDGADLVVLAIRPQVAEAVVRALRLRPGQKVLSLVAGARHEALGDWIGLDLPVIRAIPLPSVETLSCVTPVFPGDEDVSRIFNVLGGVVEVASLAEYDGYGAASAVMALYFGQVGALVDWLADQGLPRADADRYLRSLYGNLGDTLRREAGMTTEALREAHSTKGGLNEMVYDRFLAEGGGRSLRAAMDAVMARLRG